MAARYSILAATPQSVTQKAACVDQPVHRGPSSNNSLLKPTKQQSHWDLPDQTPSPCPRLQELAIQHILITGELHFG